MSAVAAAAAAPAEAAAEALALDERDAEPRTPMKRLGSTRKLAAFANIRAQLGEQARVLESRAEAAAGAAGELAEYCRRRADLEHEYARALDKLQRAAAARHRDQRAKRDHWPLVGAAALWGAALEHTRALSRDHAALAELYGGVLCARLQRAADDALRLHRKCREALAERHDELAAAMAEAANAAKAHAAASADWRAAAGKLRAAKDARDKLAANEPNRHKKLKALDKELEKRRARHSAARLRALRARADYVLSLEAANGALQRYYLDDLADIMLCMETGFEAVVGGAMRLAGTAEGSAAAAASGAAAALAGAAAALDSAADRQRVVALHAAAFAPPRPVPYRGPAPKDQDAEMLELAGECGGEEEVVRAELAARLQQLEAACRALRAECRESAKTLDAAEQELLRQMEGPEIDVNSLFGVNAAGAGGDGSRAPVLAVAADDDAPRRDQEDYYLAKFRGYAVCAGRLARLESKAAAVRARLLRLPAPAPPSPPRRAHARGHFAAPLRDRLPTVLTSCVRVIATYGLRHQGLFRVSGSQVEMQALRAAFERGEDPLARVRDAADINSVCGLLKLYLRELRPPLVPAEAAERLLRAAGGGEGGGGGEGVVARIRDALAALPTPNMIVLRYLAAFLAHLTEYSEYNMMDAWNLAICVGPTLLAAGGEGGAQVTRQNLVNELVKRVILHHRDIFPQDVAPHALYTPPTEADPVPDEEEEGAGREARARDEADGEGEDGGASDGADEPDVRDDLSLYADDDEESSSECDSGEWRGAPADGAGGARPGGAAEPCASSPAGPPPTHSVPGPRRLAEATPDLVLDLPLRTPPPPPPRSDPVPDPPAIPDTADTFAHNRDTLKKRPSSSHRHTNSEGSAESRPEQAQATAGAGETETGAVSAAEGSPVPPRNTQRVAARFAELTLTGGSKPALAAKPALLRRPTPHPHHAPPRACPDPAAPAPDS